jgi:hypothetical protein
LRLIVIEPPHHRPPPQRIASEQRNHCSPKSSNSFATKSEQSGHALPTRADGLRRY